MTVLKTPVITFPKYQGQPCFKMHEELIQFCSDNLHPRVGIHQISIDLLERFEQEFSINESIPELDAVGAFSYDISIILDVINTSLSDYKLLQELYGKLCAYHLALQMFYATPKINSK